MKHLITVFTLISFLISQSLFAQTYNWAYSTGGNGWDDLKSSHLGNDNGTVTTGMFSNTINFGSTTFTSKAYQDAFVAKYDDQGNVLWANQIGGNEQDWGYKITTDNNNNVYVTGYFQSTALYFTTTDSIVKNANSSRNVFLAKYNSNGVFQWARLGSGSTTNAFITGYSVTCDNQNNVIISGQYTKTVEFSGQALPNQASGANIYLVKFDATGNIIWTKAGVSSSICSFLDMTCDANNNIFVTGKISTAITFGSTTIPNNLGDDMVLGKFDNAGNLLWMKVIGKPISATTTGNNFDCGTSIKLDGSGNIFVGGSLLDTTYYDSNTNSLVIKQWANIAKFDNLGNEIWSNKYGLNEKDVINAIDLDANGDVYVTGTYAGNFSIGTNNITNSNPTILNSFIAKFDKTNGNPIFAYRNGISSEDMEGWGIGINQQNGNVYSTGIHRGSVAFSSNNISSIGVWDMYLTLLNNIVISSLTTVDQKINSFNIYPNPASQIINISSLNNEKIDEINIYNLHGKKMFFEKNNDAQINIEQLPVGNYLIELKSKNVKNTFSLIKKN